MPELIKVLRNMKTSKLASKFTECPSRPLWCVLEPYNFILLQISINLFLTFKLGRQYDN